MMDLDKALEVMRLLPGASRGQLQLPEQPLSGDGGFLHTE